nr:PREDICTED: biogenesis of lysosome-related organelles complex 1 subunit 5-like [Phalacrocorax carbo]
MDSLSLFVSVDSIFLCEHKRIIKKRKKLHADKLMAREEKRIAHWDEFIKEQENKQAEVDEEHRKAMERLREQYSEMEKELAKYVSF